MWIRRLLLLALCLSATGAGSWLRGQHLHWYKGNTHAHTNRSDGDASPRRAVRWYRDHKYNFLVISDHDTRTDPRPLDRDSKDSFILIPGEEVTDSFQARRVHVNGINLSRIVVPQHGSSVTDTLQRDIDAIRQAGGLPQINHPNWRWSFTDAEMAPLQNVALLEVCNVNRDCNNAGAGGRPGTEAIWDRLLSRGKMFYGIASDDTHSYGGEWTPDKASPGKGWVMVRAARLTAPAITAALERGDFYATTGVVLTDVRITPQEYEVTIEPEGDFTYTTQFIGKDGATLKEEFGPGPRYIIRGDESYVRARVIASSGEFAWTQPVFVQK